MALADHLKEPLRRAPNKVCTLGWLLSTLPEGEAHALGVMLDDPITYPAKVVADEVRNECGVAINIDAINRHRRRDCSTDPA